MALLDWLGHRAGHNGLMVVDERKLLQLSDAQALEVFRSGELSWIYAHLVSLSNLNRLVDRLADSKRSSGAVAAPVVTEAPAAKAAAPAPAKAAGKAKA